MENKVRYLVDTNVWLELLLEQEKSKIVTNFLISIPLKKMFISDFTLHSIGVILARYKKYELFEKFISDLFINAKLELLTLNTIDLLDVIANIRKYKLDFDDSYQFSVSQKYDLTIVTFDKDFNINAIKKISPEEAINLG